LSRDEEIPSRTIISKSEIDSFCEELRQEKLNRPECQNCYLFKKPMVVLDTNLLNFGPVDVAFIGLNPGVQEVRQNKPFVGRSGQRLRKQMAKMPPEIKWIIYNVILCHTKDAKEIQDYVQVMKNCCGLVAKIPDQFPSNLIVSLGKEAKESFGIKEKITAASGKVYPLQQNMTVVPIIHPSAVRGTAKEKLFNDSFDVLAKLLLENL
jgi:uracil-DNA glycosylase family 4